MPERCFTPLPPVRWLTIDAILPAAFENRMLGNNIAEVEDADQIWQLLDLDDTAGAIGHAVVVAADGDEAVVADAALELEHGIEAMLGQRLQLGLLGGERLGDDALRRAMNTDVGDGVEPIGQLSIEVVEVAEAASKEEVLSDVAERSLNLALGFGAVGPTGAGLEAIVPRQRQQRSVVDDVADIILAGHRCLHAIVQDLHRHTADYGECLDMTAEQRLQVLMHDIAREQEARVAEHQAEQPDNPAGAGIVGEVDDEAGKIDLRLNAWRRLEAHLVGLGAILGTDRGEITLHCGIGTDIAELADLAGQPRGAQVRERRSPARAGSRDSPPTCSAAPRERGP